MNKPRLTHITIIATITLMSFQAFAQRDIATYYQELYYLSKAWGHVKYKHTKVAKGDVNWDNEVLKAIGKLKNASSDDVFNEAMETMLHNAGAMAISNVPLPDILDSLNNNSNLDWIDDSIFSEAVIANLKTITQRFRPQYNVYANRISNGQLSFDRDSLYSGGTDYPDEGKRLLALFRYWNIIHYFFPYKNLMDQDWDSTLVQFIPRISNANNAASYHLAFKELTTHINDSHAFFSSSTFWNWDGGYYPPFEVRFVENEMVITNVLNSITTIGVGDVIKEIDGYDIYELRDRLRKYARGSNDVIIERQLNGLIMLNRQGQFRITVDNGSEIHTETLVRNATNFNDLTNTNNASWKTRRGLNDCTIGIVDMGRLEYEEVSAMFDDLWNTDAIIFDVRKYPNGTLWLIVDYLFPSSIYNANFTIPDISYPGIFFWHASTIGQGTNSPYSGKMAILFDERTQSQAEYTVMGLEQFPGAAKIGSTTSGADGNVSFITLPGNIRTGATFLGVFYPDYTPTQRVGIIPDIEVNPTIEGIRNRVDEVMESAYDFLSCDIVTASEKPEASEQVVLYPNPTSHSLQYKLTGNQSDNISFEIVDLQGRKVKTIQSNSSEGEIDISELKSGIYVVTVTTRNDILSKRIIKN